MRLVRQRMATATEEFALNKDYLQLKSNPQIKQMLIKHGDSWPKPETIQYSVAISKVNRKEKKQNRIFLLTDKAIYNLKPDTYDKPQRRIELSNIAAITVSKTSSEFTINVPMEYDYRYIANHVEQREELVQIVSNTYELVKKHPLSIHEITQASTLAYTVNRKVANLTV